MVENPYQSPTESVESKPRSSQPDAEPWSVWATRDTIFPRHIAALLDNIAAIALGVVAAKQLPEDQVIAAREAGVHKFNADTDLRHAFRAGIEAVWSQGDRQLEDAMAEGRTRMVAATIQKMELYGCTAKAGRAAA